MSDQIIFVDRKLWDVLLKVAGRMTRYELRGGIHCRESNIIYD